MAKYERTAGATSNIFQVFIADSSSTTGAGLTGLVFNSSSLTAYYHRDTDTTATAITLVTMTVGTFTSSGFKEIDATNMPGWYQLCPPDAALAAGAKSVGIHLKGATNMAPLPLEIDLDAQTDVKFWNGSAVSTPTNAGVPNVNVKTWNDLTTVALPLIPTTAGRTLDVSTGGEAGVDWANVGSPTTTLALTGTTIATTQKVDIETIKTNPVVNGGTITFPTTATLASTTNITAGTITTVTNLTNAATAGDLTATMKTSVTTAATAATPTAAAVTGNVGGNVVGSVGSVVGAVGSVTGAVGSVTGNVGGNVTGSVGSVVGAVGSVTGAVGSVTGNVGGNVVGSVASVTADVGITQAAADKVFGASGAAMAELTGVPSATPSPRNALMLIFMTLRNKLTTTATAKTVYNDADSAIGAKTLADNGTTYSETKMA
jgi:hypothetical protein